MSYYLFFKRSRWIILSALVWVVGCTGTPAEPKDPKAIIEAFLGIQTNTSQASNAMNAAQQTSQATIEVSSCGQTTSTLLFPH